jgi:two-component system phosphate regulon sensor histidine kinase PhoR
VRRLGVQALVPTRRTTIWLLFAGILSAGVSSLVWIAYRAVGEWQRSTTLLVDQRSEEALTLLTVALNRDMKGVHHSVLASFNEGALTFDRRYELEDTFAQAFARFPYAESFFVWRDVPGQAPASLIFNRVERPPGWAGPRDTEGAYPVVAIADAPVTGALVTRLRGLSASGSRFVAFDTAIDGARYQVVAHLLYHTTRDRPLFGAVGFTVNRDWVTTHYFQEILEQISRIGRVEDTLSLAVADDQGGIVARTRPGVSRDAILHQRTFPFSFLDADLIGDSMRTMPAVPEWSLQVSAADTTAIAAAARGSTPTRGLILLSAGVAIMGILLTLRALKASADLAAMQSEFVASATHELKTPLALFQLVADTLSKGRYDSADTIRAYGGMLAEQTQLLERLIDNVLSFASLGHVARRYQRETLTMAELVEAALERFDARLAAGGLDVNVDVPATLPATVGDRAALLQALDNVIDNAIKYSPQGQSLTIRASADGRAVRVQIIDQGVGIPREDRDKVFEKFYRGSAVNVAGSGLGLAIARRVVEDHGGTITVGDAEPHGTIVEIALPLNHR